MQKISNVVSSLFVLVVIVALGLHAFASFTGGNGTATAAPASGPVEKGKISIQIKGFAFPDGHRIVAVGTTVTWTNLDGAVHTVAAADKSFVSGNLSQGKAYSHTFTHVGNYAYICGIHQFMQGSITVVQPYGSG